MLGSLPLVELSLLNIMRLWDFIPTFHPSFHVAYAPLALGSVQWGKTVLLFLDPLVFNPSCQFAQLPKALLISISLSRLPLLGPRPASTHVQNHKCPQGRKLSALISLPRKGCSLSAILVHLIFFCILFDMFKIVVFAAFGEGGGSCTGEVACHDLLHSYLKILLYLVIFMWTN